MKKILKPICAALTAIFCFGAFAGCGFSERKVRSADLTSAVKKRTVAAKTADETFTAAYDDFAVKMTKELYDGENTCISPLSIAAAFGMVTNGAKGETKSELEALLGCNAQTLNEYFAALMNKAADGKQLHVANSVWSKKNAVTVDGGFLDIVKNYYRAQVYLADFDGKTVQDINNWVFNNTRGGIDKIIDDIDSDMVMFLINALDFEAEWQKKFEKNSVRDATFYGTKNESTVKMMYANESRYLRDENAKGFVKPYAGGEFKFAAILPDKGVDIADYLSSLTGEKLASIVSGASTEPVEIGLPKFDFENTFNLIPTLKKLGVNKAFAPDADFSALGTTPDGNLYIGQVIHKTHIMVNEQKTKASAVTIIGVKDTAVAPGEPIVLDRPFVYMILDGNDLPMFIGVVANF